MSPWLVETIVVAAVAGDRADRDARADGCAQRLDFARHGSGYGGEVDDARLGAVEGGDADGVGFDLRDLGGGQAAEARDAVLDASALELVEGAELAVVEGDDELAAALVRHVVLVAVGVEGVAALGAELGLQRARLVVDAGVDDAGVVARLVGGDLVFSFEDEDARVGRAVQQFAGRGEAEDAPADDDYIPGGSMDRGFGDAAGAVEEVEVAALVGLGDVLGEQLRVAAGGGELSGHPGQNGGTRGLLPRRAGRGGDPGRPAR